MRIANLTQHKPTTEQIKAGVEHLSEKENEIKTLLTFENIPTIEEMEDRAERLAKIVKEEGVYDATMIGGAPYFMSILEKKLKEYKDLVDKDYLELLNEVVEKARKGAHIQRYKGLGEMNPDQLWETTMNPENRVLIQVTMEDAEKAAEKFELFMGSEVGPRREYIQANAKEVENIDV